MSTRPSLDLLTILQTATEIADQQGLNEVTLANLAKRLGIRPPSLYNHVDGLPGLRTKLTHYGLEKLKNVLTQAAVGRSGDEAIRALAHAYIAFARTHPGLYEVTLSAPAPDDSDSKQIAAEIVQLIIRVMQHYEFDEEKALHAVRVFRSMLHGFSSLEQNKGFGLPLDTDITLQILIETLLAGIQALQQNNIQVEDKTGE